MKKNIYRILLISSVLFFGGCEDFVDIEQPGRLGADNAFRNVTDLELGLFGVYATLDYSQVIQFNAVFTDQISIGFDNGGQGIGGEYAFQLNAASAISQSTWAGAYGALNASTRLIEGALAITPSDEEQDDYNSILGETYALRAFAHFHLLTYYSPDLTDSNAPGIIILDFIPEVSQNLTRSTTGEVFAIIDEDIQRAEALLVEQSNPTFVSKDFVTALKARAALYRGNYEEAEAFASSLDDKYSLATRDEYKDIFMDDSNAEVIFKLERTINDRYDGQGVTGSGFAGGWAGANFAFVNATIDGSPYFEMSNSLFNVLDENDVRYDVLVEPSSDLNSDVANDGNIIAIGKYRGSQGQPLMNDLKIFRYSEMVLIKAEALARQGDFSGASAAVESIRDARFNSNQAPITYNNLQVALLDILKERRIELAYEGHRWVDLKRLGIDAGLASLIRNDKDCGSGLGPCSLSLSDIRFKALPIPNVEFDGNTAIQQTPGY